MLFLHLPGWIVEDDERLESLGFGDLGDRDILPHDDRIAYFQDVPLPPIGGAKPGGWGALVAFAGPDEDVPVEPIAVDSPDLKWFGTWERPMSPCPIGFIGYSRSVPPTPATLARRCQAPGVDVLLDDGHLWQVPALSRLPIMVQRSGMAPLRRPTSADLVLQRLCFEFIWKLAHHHPTAIEAIGGEAIIGGGMTLAEYALQVNYRCRWELTGMLGLLRDPATINAAAAAAIGLADFSQAGAKRYLERGGDCNFPSDS